MHAQWRGDWHRVLQLGVLSLSSSILGFLREIVIIRRFGATSETDAYLTALSVPTLLYFFIFGSGLNVCLVPRLGPEFAKGRHFGNRAFGEFLSLGILVGTAGFLAILFGADSLVSCFAPGIVNRQLTVEFVRHLAPVFFLLIATYSLASYQCAQESTHHWGLIGVVQNASIICGLLLFERFFGIYALLYSALGGYLLAFLLQTISARRAGFHEVWAPPSKAVFGRGVLIAMLPFALTLGIGGDSGTAQADIFLVRYFASRLGPGAITLMALGTKLVAMTTMLIGAAMGTAILPGVSAAVSRNDFSDVTKKLEAMVTYCLLITTPLFVLYVDGGEVIPKVLAVARRLQLDQVHELALILKFYSGAIIGWTLLLVLTTFLAALRKNHLLIGFGLVTLGIAAILMKVFVGRFGIPGIALAVSFSSIIYSFLLALPLARLFGKSSGRLLVTNACIILFGAVFMHCIFLIVSHKIGMRSVLDSAVVLATSLCAYLLWSTLFRKRFAFHVDRSRWQAAEVLP